MGGKDHIKFWHLDGAWTFRGKTGTFVTGTPSGNILVWNAETTLVTNVLEAHQGPVHALDFETEAQVACSSGKDGMLRLWDVSNKKKKKGPSFSLLRTIDINVIQTDDVDFQQEEHDEDGNVITGKGLVPHCRSLDWQGHSIAIGTNTNSIGEVQLKQESDNAACTTFTQAHVGRCDALCMHPSKLYFASAAEDKTLRIWDMKARKVLNVFPLPHQARCVDWSADAQYIACGLNSGEVAICRISPDMKTIELLAKKNTAPPPTTPG